ncbi:type 2 phosphatidic acid phosphatase [Grosmannia clavigera kw1407]|uniref:Type 2 phosphatidic acid phosphatase n=1 Tax=Grosmannia clavigera (strain kw1407 / UAMH 11150) TaxID=655863 RepID=F0XNC3_GROCL|nr:type 2 phosphatidic acid phosphatase [Grosmannia clavigera kw1407]EFX00801.1 type 2 phosphatidic acid phosphatase [Grosmannia clavigera kw1407]
MAFTWPTASTLSHWNPIPRKYRMGRTKRRPKPRLITQSRYFVSPESSSGKGVPNTIAALQISFNPVDGFRHLRQHRWSLYDVQYLITILFVIFSFVIASIPLPVCIAIVVGYSFLVLAPATRQFFLPSVSIWAYLLYFFCSRFIPVEYRPHIWVKVLPALENVLYGANLSNILSAHTHPVLDLLAWIPYGLFHFALPAFTSAILFFFAAPGTVPVFARCFGYLSLIGVTTQLVFPCTPPWYELANGLSPAHYGMPGSPAGLARIDKLFGIDMYTTSFSTAPVPFGAFPSLHAADAVLEAFFLSYCFPRFRVVFVGYCGWIWWATMYLNHHYAVDLVAGSLLSAFFYYVARAYFLPRRQLDKSHRWEYEYIEVGEKSRSIVDEYSYNAYEGFDIDLLPQHNLNRRSDEWTVGSTSSFATSLTGSASGSISGSVSGASRGQSSPGTMSPITPEAEFRPVTIFGMTPQGHVWDGGNTVRDSELAEVAVVG